MKHILVEMMSQLTYLNQAEEEAIIESIPIRTYPNGTYLLKEGQVARDSYFLIQGCLREYRLIDGEEKTTAFYTEHQSVANFESLTNRSASKYNLVCMESSKLAVLNLEKEQALYRRFPRFETFCRTGMEQMLGEQHRQLTELIVLKPEDRYLKLQKERPELINRVPQYQIASYLGIKPETLSRIRKRLANH
ncbi:MAG: Crp/Fnr family transcriptional regulator [Bacteroidota bacterium]